MVFDLDLGAIRSAAKTHVTTPGDVATAATLATDATPPTQSVAVVATVASRHGVKAPSKPLESVAVVATVAAVASRQRLETAANDPAQNLQKPEVEHQPATLAPPAYDPGHAALLALAMAYCDRTGASPKARAQWQQDIADTPPELRADLYQHLRAQLPPAPPRPAPATPPVKQMPPVPWTSLHQPWRAADAAYLAHWGQCPACKAAATGHTDRCATGQHLHDTYLAALATT